VVINNFAENHGGGPCDADANIARKALSNYQRNESVILNDSSAIRPIISATNSEHAFDASNFLAHYPVEKLSFTGINALYCFMVDEVNGDIIGYPDSWILVNPVSLNSRKKKGKRQELLSAKKSAGVSMKKCEDCGDYYVHQHTCRKPKKPKRSESLSSAKEARNQQQCSDGVASAIPQSLSTAKQNSERVVIYDTVPVVGDVVKVWYHSLEKYFEGLVMEVKDGLYVLKHISNGHLFSDNPVELAMEDQSDDERNEDRWYYSKKCLSL
jgi:ribosomal protein L32